MAPGQVGDSEVKIAKITGAALALVGIAFMAGVGQPIDVLAVAAVVVGLIVVWWPYEQA